MRRYILGILTGFAVASLAPFMVPGRSGGGLAAEVLAGELSMPLEDYAFRPFRNHIWVINKRLAKAIFYTIPTGEGRLIEKSRVLDIDTTRFPVESTRFLLSDRNLSSSLWLCNTVTGEILVVRPKRDGSFDTEYRFRSEIDFN